MSAADPPADSAPAEVFIRYSRRDADHVAQVEASLRQAGVSVWRDTDCISGGEYYGETIVAAIRASKVVIVMCSPNSLYSDEVHNEVTIAWRHAHRNFLPLWLVRPFDYPDRFVYCLEKYQRIEVADRPAREWVPAILRALARFGVQVAKRESAAPEPAAPAQVPATAPASAQVPVAPAEPAGERQPASEPTAATVSPAEAPAGEESCVAGSTRPGGGGPKGLRFRAGERPIPGVDLELVEPLGVGGFGEVWKANNPLVPNMRPVALKFCLDPEAQQLLRHEAATVAQLLRDGQRHTRASYRSCTPT
jgi:hypothetical protein